MNPATDSFTETATAVRRLNGLNVAFLTFSHVMAIVAIAYLAAVRFSWWTVGLGLLWLVLCGISITGGYHRLFAHASYKGSTALRLFYLLFGAASVQNSALKWSADHRRHHAHTDRDEDPYDARRGLWWSHLGWVLFDELPPRPLGAVKDLERSSLVRWQHSLYVPLALLVGAGVPAALGSLWGDALGAVLVAGFLRLVVQWHITFSINSFAHAVGHRPFSDRVSARDSFWIALLTMGEGYHNFHHRFPADYRNGVRWYHFDPTKWWVWTLARLGQAKNLRRTQRARIEGARRPRTPGGMATA